MAFEHVEIQGLSHDKVENNFQLVDHLFPPKQGDSLVCDLKHFIYSDLPLLIMPEENHSGIPRGDMS